MIEIEFRVLKLFKTSSIQQQHLIFARLNASKLLEDYNFHSHFKFQLIIFTILFSIILYKMGKKRGKKFFGLNKMKTFSKNSASFLKVEIDHQKDTKNPPTLTTNLIIF